MKTFLRILLVGLFFSSAAGLAFAGEKAPQKVIDLANSKLIALGSDPVIVSAVKQENALGKTLEQIKAKDREWLSFPGIADYMRGLMDSECGKHLRQIQTGDPMYAEIFVMDNQGANVAMTDKTSDYWQGDEAKFIEVFKGSAGAVHISEVEFDDSTQAYLVQVSIPVIDNGSVIGAVTIGINVDEVL